MLIDPPLVVQISPADQVSRRIARYECYSCHQERYTVTLGYRTPVSAAIPACHQG